MRKKIDIVLVNPGDKKQIYQGLSGDYSAVEPPFLIAALASYLRNRGHEAVIIDANAENISPEETALKVKSYDPLLSAVIVYGTQPSASTQNMTLAGRICSTIKKDAGVKVVIGGLHPSALPAETMSKEDVDFLVEGECSYAISELLKILSDKHSDFSSVAGLWYKENQVIKNNPRSELTGNIDEMLPVAAWDLLPMDKYKAHNWHCFGRIAERKPYASIYTSLGCPYDCVFCCINAQFGKPAIRYRSPELVVKEIDLLAKEYNVKNLKIADELFVLSEKHYMRIVDLLIEKRHNLNIWAYARIDTVKAENLHKMKKAGINWLALGIESADQAVKSGAAKKMTPNDIDRIVKDIRDAGINVIGNYIFGLPDDTFTTMRKTLDMAMGLNCEFANFYCAMAYPGSKLYGIAKKNSWELPSEWHGFSQHSYETLPLPTKYLTAKEVLGFRDRAFQEYFSNPVYLNMISKKFGPSARAHIEDMVKIKLARKIME